MQKTFTRTLTLFLATAILSTTLMSATLPAPPSTEPTPTQVKAAVSDFNNLTKKEKKEKVREVKKLVKQYKAEKKQGNEPSTDTLLLVILAILLPPLAVYLHEGEINTRFWISLLLTLLFWVPGVIYALIVVLGDGSVKAKTEL
jgi:uncharacterized membrane protein YqaE (UPF0057 family)